MVQTTGVITYDGPKGITPSDLYRVQVNGRDVFVYPCKVGTIHDPQGTVLPTKERPETIAPAPAAFCYFDFTGKVEVKVTVNRALRSAIVRPTRHGIKPGVGDNTITFTLDEPCKLSIEPNGSLARPLFLFAGAPEDNPPKPDDPDIDLYYGPGIHYIGYKRLPSDTTVYIAGGAVVYGHFSCFGVKNVRIFGRGILDAGKSPRKHDKVRVNKFGRYTHLIRIGFCSDVTIDGICLIDSPTWTCRILHSRNVTVRNVKIITWRENGDGIDFVSCEQGTVDDCFLRTWDDALVVKGFVADRANRRFRHARSRWPQDEEDLKADLKIYRAYPVRDITFSNCVIWLDRAQALEIGHETCSPEITNVVFRDIDIIHDLHNAAIDITNCDRARVHNIRFENIRIEDPRSDYLFRFRNVKSVFGLDHRLGIDYGPINNVVLRNIEVFGENIPPSWFDGQTIKKGKDASQVKIDRITFRNLRFNGKVMRDMDEAKFRRGRRVGKITLKP